MAKPATAQKTTAKQEPQEEGDSMLREFFLDCLKDVYWAENAILKALPKMKKAATTEELQDAFQEHITVTQGQVARLDEVFGLLDEKAEGKKCEAMAGIIKEGEEIISDTEEGTATRDVGLIMAAQKVEHYEIATYGGLVQLARTLGEEECADLLQETLNEEKETDVALTEIAENSVNYDASQEDAEDEE